MSEMSEVSEIRAEEEAERREKANVHRALASLKKTGGEKKGQNVVGMRRGGGST